MTSANTTSRSGHLLVDRELRALVAGAGASAASSAIRARPGAPPPSASQVQPASIDLRLGAVAHRIRCGFLPSGAPVETRLAELSISSLSLEGDGAVLERGLVYLVPLEEELALPTGLRARFNPRSSAGRCDIFTRVLCSHHPRFDEAPEGFAGPLWLEVVPLSFPVRLCRGDRLCQMRLVRGQPEIDGAELRALHARTPLCFVRSREGVDRPLTERELRIDADGALSLSVSLAGRSPAGWRAADHADVLRFAESGAHDPAEFFEPVAAPGGRAILRPGSFYLFASRERISIPPTLAAEMQPVDVGIGELRNNYAGFFDSGFGWRTDEDGARGTHAVLPAGTPAVLEVRAHDVPFLVEDGQVLFRLRVFRTSGPPERLYGQGPGASYGDQDLTLARCFRPIASSAPGV